MRRLVQTVGIFLLVLSLFPSLALARGDIKIGISTALTGPSSEIGYLYLQGAQTYFKHANKYGGINGQVISLNIKDDQYNPEKTVANTVQFIENDNVDLLFGYVGTPTVTRILPLLKQFQKRNISLFFPFTGAHSIRSGQYVSLVYNLRPSYKREAEELVNLFTQQKKEKIAIFYQIDSFGRDGYVGVSQALKSQQKQIVAEATYARGSTFEDSYQVQAQLLNDASPDAIIIVASYQAAAGFIRDLRNLGSSIPVATVSFVSSDSLLNYLKKLEEKNGKDYSSHIIQSQVIPFTKSNLPAANEYRTLMNRYFPNERLNAVGFEGFLAAKTLVKLLKSQPVPFSKKRFLSSLPSSPIDIGIGTSIRVSYQKDALDRIHFETVKNGSWVEMGDSRGKNN